MATTKKAPFSSNAQLTVVDDLVNGGLPTQATYVSWSPRRPAFIVVELPSGERAFARLTCAKAT